MSTESHIYIEQLASKGVPAEQAKAIVEFAIQLQADRAVTKSDLEKSESRVTAKLDVIGERIRMQSAILRNAAIGAGAVLTIGLGVIGYLLQQLINLPK